MACTKNMERKPSRPSVARFPVIATGKAERDAHYRQKAVATTPTTEVMDWTELNPTLPVSTSPALENTVDRLNEAYLSSTLTMDDVAEIVADLYANPPTTPTDGAASEAARPEDRQDLPTTSTAPTGSVTSETTGQTSHPPILLARKAMATLVSRKGRPNPPTAAAKCPRQHFREPIEEVKSHRKSRPQALSALGEIKKYQRSSPSSPGCPSCDWSMSSSLRGAHIGSKGKPSMPSGPPQRNTWLRCWVGGIWLACIGTVVPLHPRISACFAASQVTWISLGRPPKLRRLGPRIGPGTKKGG